MASFPLPDDLTDRGADICSPLGFKGGAVGVELGFEQGSIALASVASEPVAPVASAPVPVPLHLQPLPPIFSPSTVSPPLLPLSQLAGEAVRSSSHATPLRTVAKLPGLVRGQASGSALAAASRRGAAAGGRAGARGVSLRCSAQAAQGDAGESQAAQSDAGNSQAAHGDACESGNGHNW
ncbi:unnamed protein product [Closterium sp. NIES-54]